MQFSESIANIDLLLTRYKPSQSVHLKKTLPQIKKLLDQKNKRYNFPPNVLDRASYELDKRGADHSKIDTLAVEFKQLSQKLMEKQQHKNIFDKQLSLSTINEYLDAKIDQCRVSNIEFLMSQTQVNQRFRRRIMDRMGSQAEALHQQYSGVNPANRTAKDAYHKTIRKYLKSYCSMTVNELTLALYTATNNPIWKILQEQFEGCEKLYQQGSNLDLKFKIKENTMNILEKRFAETLPKEYSLDQYYSDFMSNKSSNTYMNRNGRPVWALSYLLFRAGKKESLLKFLEGENDDYSKYLLRDLRKYYECKTIAPQKFIWKQHNVSDIYLDQIYSAINANPESDQNLVAKPFDFIWFGLQTCTLPTYAKQSRFSIIQLQRYIQNVYNKQPNSREATEQLFYSLNYDALLQLRNSYIDRDERMHMAIIFNLARFQQNDLIHQRDLAKDLLNYANEVLIYGIDVSMDYLTLQPSIEEFVENLTNFLIYNDRLEEFFGFGYAQGHPSKRFSYILDRIGPEETTKLYVHIARTNSQVTHRYITSAKIMYYILGDITSTLNYYIRSQLQTLINPMITQKQKIEAQKLIQTILSTRASKSKITPTQQVMLDFFNIYKSAVKASDSKNFAQIKAIFDKQKHLKIVPSEAMNPETLSILDNLVENHYLEVFCRYVMMIVKLYDVYCSYLVMGEEDYKRNVRVIAQNFDMIYDYLKLHYGRIASDEKRMLEEVRNQIIKKVKNLDNE